MIARMFLGLALALLPLASAWAAPDELVSLDGKTPFVPQADRAYILLRIESGGFTADLLRIPTTAELTAWREVRANAFAKAEPGLRAKREAVLARQAAAQRAGKPFTEAIPPEPMAETFPFNYDAVGNLSAIDTGRTLERAGRKRTVLIAAVPGRYVLYGIGYGQSLMTCLCLGSVSFDAPAGKIVDLGEFAVDFAGDLKKSTIPELAEETGLGFSMNGHVGLFAAVLRPATAQTPRPPLLDGLAVEPAQLRAQGKFTSPWATNINRLVAIPGVLGYARGTVLDLKSGAAAPDQY